MTAADLLVREAEALVADGQVATALGLLRRRGAIAHCAAFSTSARDAVVTALVEAGDIDDAYRITSAAVVDDLAAAPMLANLIVRYRRWREAKAFLEHLSERYPDSELINGLLVFALVETGQFADAVTVRQQFSATRWTNFRAKLPNTPPNQHFALAWDLLSGGDFVAVRQLMADHAIAVTAGLDLDRDVERGLSTPGSPCTPAPAGPKRELVLALAVRDEVDILEANLDWHFAHGIDAAIVTDNGSVDGTRALLDQLATRLPLVIIDEPVQDMDQSKWSTRMAWLAREAFDADWVLLGDADEFFSPSGGSFADAIAAATQGWAADATVLAIPSQLMLLDADAGLNGQPPFHAATRCLVDPLPRCLHGYVMADYNLLSVMTQIQKVWVRASSLPIVLPGNHVAISRNAKLVPAPEITCLHFSYRDFGRWFAKQNRFVAGFAANTSAIDRASVDYWATNQGLWTAREQAEAMYRRLQFGTPFHHYLAESGRIVEQTVVRDFVTAGSRPTPTLLSPAEAARCRAVLADLDHRLPRCIR